MVFNEKDLIFHFWHPLLHYFTKIHKGKSQIHKGLTNGVFLFESASKKIEIKYPASLCKIL